MQMQQRDSWYWSGQVASVVVFVAWGAALLVISLMAEGFDYESSHSDWIQARVAVGLVAFGLPLGVAAWRHNMAYTLLAIPISLVLLVGADLVMP